MAKKNSKGIISEGDKAVTIYKMSCALAEVMGTDETSREVIQGMMIEFNDRNIKPPLKLDGQNSLLTHVNRAIDWVADNVPEELTHTLREVDQQNHESFIDGYASGFNVFMDACDKSLKNLDDVMGFYMEDELGRYDDRAKELHLAHMAIRYVMAKMSEAYDEKMVELKDLWDLEDYIANID